MYAASALPLTVHIKQMFQGCLVPLRISNALAYCENAYVKLVKSAAPIIAGTTLFPWTGVTRSSADEGSGRPARSIRVRKRSMAPTRLSVRRPTLLGNHGARTNIGTRTASSKLVILDWLEFGEGRQQVDG